MKLGIHHRSGSFSDGWIEWCNLNGVAYKLVNAYASDIVQQLKDCNGFMWHWHQDDYADQLFARQLTLALERNGVPVFPSVNTAWHFDDKIGQKYLFEVADLPLVPSYVFYRKVDANFWLDTAVFPLVFKLRGGAGSINVKLVSSLGAARKLVDQAFKKGFPVVDLFAISEQSRWEFQRDRTLRQLLRAIYHFLRAVFGVKPTSMTLRHPQQGYVYFQEFLPNNGFDDRLVVIGNRCFCVRRHCRTGDFRASGSGVKSYDHSIFPVASIDLAFSVAKKLGTQCVAMDIIYDAAGCPRLVEVSYAFVTGSFYEDCDGYFNNELVWRDEKVRPQVFMIEDFVSNIVSEFSRA